MSHKTSCSSDSTVTNGHASRPCRLPGLIQGVVTLGVAAVAGVALANKAVSVLTPQLSPRLRGQFGRYPARFGDIGYTVAGTGTPVLLLHGLDPGRSMAEWRGAFEGLANTHKVYALDWLGWGLSDAARDGYSAPDFAEIVTHFIRDVIGEPTVVMAAGQGAVFAVLAASQGAKISKLVLVCPVPPAYDAPSGQSRAEAMVEGAVANGFLRAPVVGLALINVLRSAKSLERWAVVHGFKDGERARREVKTLHVTAHQDPAGVGIKNFMLGAFHTDWREAWQSLGIPALIVWGREALAEGFDSSPEWLALQPLAHLEVIDDAMLLPHLEAPEAFLERVEEWLAQSSAS